jgi:hypothetical protein
MLRFAFVAGIYLVVVYLALRRSLRAPSVQIEVESLRPEQKTERIARGHAGSPRLPSLRAGPKGKESIIFPRLLGVVRFVLAVFVSTLVTLLVFGVSTADAGRYFPRSPVTIENPSAKVAVIALALTLGIDLALIAFLAFLPCRRQAGSEQSKSPRTERQQSGHAKPPSRWRQPERRARRLMEISGHQGGRR